MYDAIKQLGDIDKALVFLYLEDKDYTEIAVAASPRRRAASLPRRIRDSPHLEVVFRLFKVPFSTRHCGVRL